MRTSKAMRRLADALIDPIQVPVPADPEGLFDALIDSVSQWRGRTVYVHRKAFPPHTASGLWLERATYDDVIVDARAAKWHQIVIFCHEVWHMSEGGVLASHPVPGEPLQPAAARTDFSVADEQVADQFGMFMGRRLRAWLEASADSVYAAQGGSPDDLSGRIGAALNYRGIRR
ncbi:toxin [Streptomyces sp. ADMS]|uniref:toxin n=1 Tax=Streptomyces sp. ADMS TaxID=3071415 RepID=UPI00296F99AF|nr:toxin [Streptomyces sp. ADMS]MDW4910065.1 toxin [Streptomyces sp. ADMS]